MMPRVMFINEFCMKQKNSPLTVWKEFRVLNFWSTTTSCWQPSTTVQSRASSYCVKVWYAGSQQQTEKHFRGSTTPHRKSSAALSPHSRTHSTTPATFPEQKTLLKTVLTLATISLISSPQGDTTWPPPD